MAPSSRSAPLERAYHDLDVAIPFRARPAAIALLTEAGYVEHKSFNALNGHRRMIFADPGGDRHLDVFVDQMHLCHLRDLKGRFDHRGPTIPPADLLLSKLQIVELNRKDLPLAGSDWGLWRTITGSLDRVAAFEESDLGGWGPGSGACERARTLRRALEETPKSLGWRLRAAVGERVRWYELPEDRA